MRAAAPALAWVTVTERTSTGWRAYAGRHPTSVASGAIATAVVVSVLAAFTRWMACDVPSSGLCGDEATLTQLYVAVASVPLACGHLAARLLGRRAAADGLLAATIGVVVVWIVLAATLY